MHPWAIFLPALGFFEAGGGTTATPNSFRSAVICFSRITFNSFSMATFALQLLAGAPPFGIASAGAACAPATPAAEIITANTATRCSQ